MAVLTRWPRCAPRRVGLRGEHAELVAAEPGDGVLLANRRVQRAGDVAEKVVARVVPEAVVHELEAVEVEHEHREAVLLARVAGDLVVDPPRQPAAVVGAGERVGERGGAQRAAVGVEPRGGRCAGPPRCRPGRAARAAPGGGAELRGKRPARLRRPSRRRRRAPAERPPACRPPAAARRAPQSQNASPPPAAATSRAVSAHTAVERASAAPGPWRRDGSPRDIRAGGTAPSVLAGSDDSRGRAGGRSGPAPGRPRRGARSRGR